MSSHNDSYIASGNSPTHREILNDRDRSPAIPPVISASITVAVDPENSIDDQNVTVQKTLSFLHICLLVCLMNGRVKTVRHRKILALVVGETQCLRHIVTSDDCADFWIPRRPADRQSFKIWRRDRSRAHKILRPPVYHGECKPEGYKTVRLESVFPSGRYLIRLCNDLGYEHEAALAATLRAHAPQFRPVKDRRRGGSSEVNEATGGSRSSAFAGSYHPSSPSRRTLTGGGLPYFKVYRAVEKHRWDDETSRCVLEIVYARQSPKDLAAKTGLAVKTLNEYAYRIRREIEATGYKNCVSLAVTY